MLSDKTLRLLNSGVDTDLLNNKYISLKQQAQSCIGYPTNQAYDYSELLPFLEMSLNNIGDPSRHHLTA